MKITKRGNRKKPKVSAGSGFANVECENAVNIGSDVRIPNKEEGPPPSKVKKVLSTSSSVFTPAPSIAVPDQVSKSMDLSSAISLALAQTSQLPLGGDTCHHSIGAACRVFWDDEGRWFTARVLLYDPNRNKHFIYYDEDQTTEWVDASDASPDAVQVSQEAVLHKTYPALRYSSSAKAKEVLGVKTARDTFYVEFFQHKKGQPPEYVVTAPRALRLLTRRHCDDGAAKASTRLAFSHAVAELEAVQRTREAVLAACKTRLCSGQVGEGTRLVGLRVRTSSCSVSAIAALFASSSLTPARVQEQDLKVPYIPSSSDELGDDVVADTGTASVPGTNLKDVQLVKCLGTITTYCPGNDEHFVVFDNCAVIAPKWIRIGEERGTGALTNRRPMPAHQGKGQEEAQGRKEEEERLLVERDIAGRPNDVELLLEWSFPGDDGDDGAGRGRAMKRARDAGEDHQEEEGFQGDNRGSGQGDLLCGLCGLGSFEGEFGAVSTCSVCRDHHFHRHCMPMGRVSLTEDQSWRCWHCTCCECCGVSAWYRESRLESLNDILLAAAPGKNEESVPDSEAEGGMSKQVLELALAQGEPLTSRGLCQPCVDMLTTGKGYCAVCYRKYIDDTPLLLPPPPVTVPAAAGRGKAAQALPTVSMSMGAEVAEEAQQMVCCDECNEWVHSRCEGIDRSQYESIANGTHPVWGNEYLCPLCRIKIPLSTVASLLELDKSGIFHFPITTAIASTYFDVIRHPMDLSSMRTKAGLGQYKALQALRADFELMCLNALTFNKAEDEYWTIARLFYNRGVAMFTGFKRTTTSSAYGAEVKELLKAVKGGFSTMEESNSVLAPALPPRKKAKVATAHDPDEYKKAYVASSRRGSRGSVTEASVSNSTSNAAKSFSSYSDMISDDTSTKVTNKKRRGSAVAVDSSTPGTSLMSSSGDVSTLTGLPTSLYKGLPFLEFSSPTQTLTPETQLFFSLECDLRALIPFDEHVLSTDVAFYTSCQEACAVCASSGAPEYFLFCQDCGECFHSFCVDSPLPLMLKQEECLSTVLKDGRRGRGSVPARGRWKCSACRLTCAVCQEAVCPCPPASHSPISNSHFISCSVCEAVSHLGCIPYLSVNAWSRLAAGRNDGEGREGGGLGPGKESTAWVCGECCVCLPCQEFCDGSKELIEARIGSSFFGRAAGRERCDSECSHGKSQPLWGFSSDHCVQCTTRALYCSRTSTGGGHMILGKRPLLHQFLDLPSDMCGHCGLAVEAPHSSSSLCCSLCFRYFHPSCCQDCPFAFPPKALWGGKQSLSFICRTCDGSEHALFNGTSHVGSGAQAARLLQSVSVIQQRRLQARTQSKVQKKLPGCVYPVPSTGPAVSRPEGWRSSRPILGVIVAWAARRCHFLGQSSLAHQTIPRHAQPQSTFKRCNPLVSRLARGRSYQFFWLWSLLDENAEDAEAHKTALMRGGLFMPSGTSSNRQERPTDSLIAVASVASCFLHESSEELVALSASIPSLAASMQQRASWLASPPSDMMNPLLSGPNAVEGSAWAQLKSFFLHFLTLASHRHEDISLLVSCPKDRQGSAVAGPSVASVSGSGAAGGAALQEGEGLKKQLWQSSVSALAEEMNKTYAEKDKGHCVSGPAGSMEDTHVGLFGVRRRALLQNTLRLPVQSIPALYPQLLPASSAVKPLRPPVTAQREEEEWSGLGELARAAVKVLNQRVAAQLEVGGKRGKTPKISSQEDGARDLANTSFDSCAAVEGSIGINTIAASTSVEESKSLSSEKVCAASSNISKSVVDTSATENRKGDVKSGTWDDCSKSAGKNDDKKEKKKKKKESDLFRKRWEGYERRHSLNRMALSGGKGRNNNSTPLLLTSRRMPTALKYSEAGWVNGACTSVGNSDHEQPGVLTKSTEGDGDMDAELDPWELCWSPVECCTFCHGGAEDESGLLGRLLPFTGTGSGGSRAGGLWAHINCVRTAGGCHEWPSGAITGAEKSQERAQETLCELCGETGAAVRCDKVPCKERYFHLPCAVACGFSFTEVKRARMGVARLPHSLSTAPGTTADRKYFVVSACCEAHRMEVSSSADRKVTPPPDLRVLRPPLHRVQVVEDNYQEEAQEVGFTSDPTSSRSYNRLHTCGGMQYRPLGTEAGLGQAGRTVLPRREGGAREQYWEHRQQLLQEKATLLRAGGHGVRIGALTLLRLGAVSLDLPRHHSCDYLFPKGFKSSRIFWSCTAPMTRALYTFEIQATDQSTLLEHQHQHLSSAPVPQFLVAVSDEPGELIVGSSMEQCYLQIVQRVRECNALVWPEMFASLLSGAGGGGGRSPSSAASFNLGLLRSRAACFFGPGLDLVRYALETQSESLAMMAPALFFNSPSEGQSGHTQVPAYWPRFHLPGAAQLGLLRRRQKQKGGGRRNLQGSARAEGWMRGSAGQLGGLEGGRQKQHNGVPAEKSSKSKGEQERTAVAKEEFKDEWGEETDAAEGTRRKARLLRKYEELSARFQIDPLEKLEVRRSGIHGYGLYARVEIARDEMVIEYIGEQVRQVVADMREEAYEEQGLGSCYMFRLDREYIVDATHTGSMARFLNHCCEANAYARVISVAPLEGGEASTEGPGVTAPQQEGASAVGVTANVASSGGSGLQPVEKRIVIFAGRTVQPGEEITYDYKFPLEDNKLRCFCGATKCRGTMN